jgi:hypothetical protein
MTCIEKLEVEVEIPAEAHERELDDYEPEASAKKESAQRANAAPADSVEVGRNPGEKNESWRAEMGDPARQKDRWIGDVAGIKTARAEEVAGMIERHEHDGQAAQEIDALKTF